ncbi:MAG: hypothetical protein K2M48_00620 [Clostridiales bacterium]|nr:hypothetical protein [Clostridiales bacterium]
MSKESRRIKEQVLVNSAISSIKKQLNDLENSRNKYIEAAATARENGITSQYELAKNAIKIVTAQKTVVEQMLLSLQLSSQIKDVSEMTKSFADGMKLLTGSITDTTENLNFEKVGKQMSKAMISTQLKQEQSDAFLDASQAGFSGFAASGSDVKDADIDRMIADGTGGTLDDELSALEKKIKSFNNSEKA